MTRLWLRTLLVTADPGEAEPVAERHREHLRELVAAGKLHVAGEFADGGGFVEVFRAVDRREAETVARSSPLVEHGLVAWTLREWIETHPPGIR